MKRSEVLSIIEKHVFAIRRGAMLGFEYDLDSANNILRDLEKIGMGYIGDTYVAIEGWESEDE